MRTVIQPLAYHSPGVDVTFDAVVDNILILKIDEMRGAWTMTFTRNDVVLSSSRVFGKTCMQVTLDGGSYRIQVSPIPGEGGDITIGALLDERI